MMHHYVNQGIDDDQRGSIPFLASLFLARQRDEHPKKKFFKDPL